MKKSFIKITRMQKEYSQEQMSRLLDISLRHYQKIENSEVAPNVYLGLKLAKILEIDPYYLFDIDNKE